MTILEEARHSLILVEHDPMLYEDAREMTEYISGALQQAAQKAAVLLFASGVDPYFEELVQIADRVWYFDEGPRAEARMVAKTHPWLQESQTTLEAFTCDGCLSEGVVWNPRSRPKSH